MFEVKSMMNISCDVAERDDEREVLSITLMMASNAEENEKIFRISSKLSDFLRRCAQSAQSVH